MKFSALVTLLPLLSSSVAYAMTARDVIRARQAHVRRSLVDVCAALDLDIQVAPAGHNIVTGHLNLCLCLSVLPGFLDSHPLARKVIDGVGRDGARDYFAELIRNQKGKQECHYPQHARPFCSLGYPCDFTCGDGYTPSPSTNPTDCVCKPPYSECNGVCGSFPHGCGSQGLSRRKRDGPTCPAGKTICGVPDCNEGHDCVDIKSDPESCGGCTVASPFGGNVADGKNCKDIPHVEKVLCDNGSCKVLSCKSGFIVSDSHDSCVKARLNRVRRAQGVGIIDEVLGLLVRQELLVRGFDILAAKEDLLASVQVLDYDHVLKALLAEGAIVGITDLLKLKEVLGLGVSVLRREITDLDSLLDLIVKQGLFVDGFDILAAKENLLAVLKVFDVSHVLELLLLQNAFVDIHDLLTLKDRLGLDFTILRRDVVYTVGGILGLLLKEDLIVGFHDLLTLKEFLGIKIDALDVDSLLKLLIVEGLIVKIIDIVALKQFLGLGVNVL